VFADKRAAAIWVRQCGAGGKRQPERGDMGAQRVIGHDGFRHQVRPLRLHAVVDVLAEIAGWRAIKWGPPIHLRPSES
jgi:hypothetical protein